MIEKAIKDQKEKEHNMNNNNLNMYINKDGNEKNDDNAIKRRKSRYNEDKFDEDNYFDNIYNLNKIDLIDFAKDAWDLYIYNVKKELDLLIDIYEMQSLLDVIGIKKNIIEIKMKLIVLAQKKPKEYPSDKFFSFDNFLDVVESFKSYRVEDKLLVSAFQAMEVNFDGMIDENNLMIVNHKYKLNLTRQEILDILNFFNENPVDNPSLSFEDFCNLYYQG